MRKKTPEELRTRTVGEIGKTVPWVRVGKHKRASIGVCRAQGHS